MPIKESCPFCLGRQILAAPMINGLAHYQCESCGKSWDVATMTIEVKAKESPDPKPETPRRKFPEWSPP